MNKLFAIFCLWAAIGVPAAAQDAPSGNLPADFYPRATCVKPDLTKLDRFDDMEVLRYNRMIKAYNACGKDYVANAGNDAERVLAMINAQVALVNGEAPPVMPSGASNLPAGFYPASICVRPDKTEIGTMPSSQIVPMNAPGKPNPEGQAVMDAMAAYNARVTRYNLQAAAFGACSKDYIARARIDLAHIEAASYIEQ